MKAQELRNIPVTRLLDTLLALAGLWMVWEWTKSFYAVMAYSIAILLCAREK